MFNAVVINTPCSYINRPNTPPPLPPPTLSLSSKTHPFLPSPTKLEAAKQRAHDTKVNVDKVHAVGFLKAKTPLLLACLTRLRHVLTIEELRVCVTAANLDAYIHVQDSGQQENDVLGNHCFAIFQRDGDFAFVCWLRVGALFVVANPLMLLLSWCQRFIIVMT